MKQDRGINVFYWIVQKDSKEYNKISTNTTKIYLKKKTYKYFCQPTHTTYEIQENTRIYKDINKEIYLNTSKKEGSKKENMRKSIKVNKAIQ